jgi:hypothetical protein
MRSDIAAGDADERGTVNYLKYAVFPLNRLCEEQTL